MAVGQVFSSIGVWLCFGGLHVFEQAIGYGALMRALSQCDDG